MGPDSAVELEARLHYRFSDPALAAAALTHRSAAGTSNERLEFVGDAVLGLTVAEALYEQCPALEEGDLTRMRAHLVNREALAQLARALDLGALLAMGPGEQRSGGFQRRSTLEDALEAVLGAVFVDGGYGAARRVVRGLFAERLAVLPDPASLKDAKTRLQEALQARALALPEYRLVVTAGPEHAREFTAECRIGSLGLSTRGCGRTRRQAEQEAATHALAKLGE